MERLSTIWLLVFCVSCFNFGDYAPSDAQIQEAVRVVETTPPDSPEFAAAVAKLDALRSQRAQADATVGVASNGLNVLVPGLGGLLAVAYGAMQRIRGQKNKNALNATRSAIDEFKEAGGEASVDKLMEMLAKNHDRAGVRTAIRQALAELKAPDHAL